MNNDTIFLPRDRIHANQSISTCVNECGCACVFVCVLTGSEREVHHMTCVLILIIESRFIGGPRMTVEPYKSDQSVL